MIRNALLIVLMTGPAVWAQSSSNQGSSNPPQSSLSPSNSGDSSSNDKAGKPAAPKPAAPDLSPPRSDRVDASALDDVGESSSKDTQVDLTAPENDARMHPHSADALTEAETETTGGSDVQEFHPWDPHKAAKSVEVGDFYFKRKNYRAAEDRYREALTYKNNDAIATFRLAVCLEKLDRPDDARAEYQSYLNILPHGPQAAEAQKAMDRLKGPAASAKDPK